MAGRVKIKEERLLSRKWGELREYVFEHLRGDGRTQMLSREVYHRGDSVAILIICRSRQTVVMTRQLRMPMFVGGYDEGLVIEVPAGLVDGREPADAALREAEEETGLVVNSLTKVLEVFPNPSVTTERVHLFTAECEPTAAYKSSGGLECEGEDIEIVEIPIREVMEMIKCGTIRDSKTIILFLFAAANNLI